MDKYDVLIIKKKLLDIIEFIKEIKRNPYEIYKRYLLHKKDIILRNSYIDILKKCKRDTISHKAVEKAFVMDTNKRYAWEVFEPIKEQKKESK